MSSSAERRPRTDEPLVAITPFGLETVCAEEITRIGGYAPEPRTGVVQFIGDLYEANLRLRTAMRILRPLREFTITTAKGLYAEARRVDWPSILTPSMTFAVDAHTRSELLRSDRYVGQVVKDAVADSLRGVKGKRPSVDVRDPDVKIHVSVNDRRVWLALDSSDPALFRRGYRVARVEAPMNECLAAAIVRMSGFDGRGVFIDPMCGSGTIAIEAALIAANRAPGLLRERFGFMGWRDFDGERYRRAVKRAEEESADPAVVAESSLVMAADHDEGAVSSTRLNAKAAGVEVHLVKSRFDELVGHIGEPERRFIADAFDRFIVMNPPYGERLAVEDETTLYRSIGDTLKQDFPGFTAWIITASAAGRKSIGLRHSASVPLWNGGLECRLRRYDMH